MARNPRDWPGDNGRACASSLSAAESPHAARKVAISVVRRQGFLLACIHEVVMADLIRRDDEAGAEEFNDAVKPLVDMMLTFDFGQKELPNVS